MKQAITLPFLSGFCIFFFIVFLFILPSGSAQTWSAQSSGTTQILTDVWASDASNAWAVGYVGTIQKWDGSNWSSQSSGTTHQLNGVWGSDASNVWAVGAGGTILKWNGSNWSAQSSGTSSTFIGVWGLDASNVWAVGAGGTIQKWNGTNWSAQTSGTPEEIYSVWGLDASNVWAVGEIGTILKWDGSNWSAQSSGTTQLLHDIWGIDASNIWTVGGTGTHGGTILKWDGSNWSAQDPGTNPTLHSVWGTDASNVLAVGRPSTIRRWNGSNWSGQSYANPQILRGVWGSDAFNIWAVGVDGTIIFSSNALPVELTYFSAFKRSVTVALTWRTASEHNNQGFDIERSEDGRTWESIGFVAGHGTTLEAQTYSFTDEQPLPGHNYYRLKQLDFDGETNYSDIRSVMMDENSSLGLSVLPNPVSQLANIYVHGIRQEAILIITDEVGRTVWSQQVEKTQQTIQFDLTTRTFENGIYFVSIITNGEKITQRLVVAK